MFSDIFYFLLLGAAAVGYRFSDRRFKPVVLAIAGLFFYIYYAGYWAILLVALALFSWGVLFGIQKDEKKVLLSLNGWAAVVAATSLGVLAVFKYSGFFLSTIHVRVNSLPAVPLALSFFTFEFVHVAIERRRRHIQNIPFTDYLAFIFFFPTMIAGPIKRWGHFRQGLDAPKANSKDILEGIYRIALGLFKKLFIADNLNLLITEIGRPHPGAHSYILIAGVVLYGFRIWLDFAGYSDIAIGSARLFGIVVPENFLSPYTQTNIAAFWRNWHISLTNWFIDYVFIPLGGSRVSVMRGCFNVIVVMTLSGLWHGAAWNFVLWGIWHGLLLAGLRLYHTYVMPKLPVSFVQSFAAKALSYILTMSVVWFGWLLFMWPLGDVAEFFKILLHR